MDSEAPNLPVEVIEELCRQYREDERVQQLHRTVLDVTMGGAKQKELASNAPDLTKL